MYTRYHSSRGYSGRWSGKKLHSKVPCRLFWNVGLHRDHSEAGPGILYKTPRGHP